jgi:hypothetical protein
VRIVIMGGRGIGVRLGMVSACPKILSLFMLMWFCRS